MPRVAWLLPLLALGALVVYLMTPRERAIAAREGLKVLRRAATETARLFRQPAEAGEPSPPVPLATWAIVLVNLSVFLGSMVTSGTLGDGDILVSWGGNLGPRTTNGEWWRLVTAAFVHAGPLHLVAMVAGLVQVGAIAERLVGRIAFLAVYLSTGMLANLVCLYGSPVSVATGSEGAILGIYGLLIATWTWRALRGLPGCPGRGTARQLIPGVALFLLYALAANRLGRQADVAAFASGAIIGLWLARGARDHKPAVARVAVLTGATAVLMVVLAVPLRGLTDVRPEIARLIAMEDRTTVTYDAAVLRFTNGAIPAARLVQMIEQTIVPDLRAARARLAALQKVPRPHEGLVALAGDYLRLREESWCLRSEALRTSRPRMLREADRREWQALEALGKIREMDPGRT